ncbi:hypothetical protein HJC23_006006 [Cyclotella cryptica]|uniref:Uncharacterized protein n=1 Tax=Cyclotella cryptica TaxID=29204 RepID=A0ABD3P4U2_9STRA|eukprot:CCRYP_017889-RA/>CCRYP_017889-RA protein AED:0.08 eAED:0.08 QI:0/-1/0/1/-1/1/1/0/522
MTSQADKLISLLNTQDDKLYGLHDIGTTRSWDYSLPTIASRQRFTKRLNFKSDESFFNIFKDVNHGLPYEILEHAGVFKKDNDIVLFGGCLLDIVLGRHDSIKDFDLRLVGEEYMDDEAKCIDVAKDFVSSLFQFISKENEKIDQLVAKEKEEGNQQNSYHGQKCDLQEIVVSRARSTVTVHIPSFGDKEKSIFQLTFSPAPTVHKMLGKCQPYCTRLAVKDGVVVLDHLACFSIESTAIVLDTSSLVNFYCGDFGDEDEQARRVSSGLTVAVQFARYIGYNQEKGFDIILPQLDMSKVPRRNLEYDIEEVLPLPCMTVVYRGISNNLILTSQLDLPKNVTGKIPECGLIGSYDSSATPDVGISIHHNIRCLVNEVYDSFKYVAKGERWEHVFEFVPSLTPRMVKKSYETVLNDLRSGTIQIDQLTGYFSVTQPDEVVEKLFAKPLREKICQKGTLPKPFSLDTYVLNELAEMEMSCLIEKIESLRETMVGRGLDKLVCPFPENVSTKEEVFEEIYGSNGIK